MKSRLIFAVGAACMFAVIGMAHSQSLQQEKQPPGAPTTQQNAADAAQSGTDASYGGVPATRSVAGGMHTKPCRSGPQCDIFFGH
jgi:hypothetical protein